MPGLWERLHPLAEDRLTVHLIEAAMVLHGTDALTKPQILAALNAKLEAPLTAAEIADLETMANVLAAQATIPFKLLYMQKIAAWTIAAEAGSVDEAAFRAGLQLP